MNIPISARLAFGLLLLVACVAARAEMRAWLDRDRIALGESVTLNVQVEGAGASMPDFSALQGDFELLGTSSSSQLSIVNGQRSANTLFAVALSAKREGVITIPALEVDGQRSEPLLLTVTPSPIASGAGGDLFIETELEPRNPYVQQEVIYTLRLFYAVNLLDGQLDAPAVDGLRMTRLGEDTRFQAERGGRRYLVAERRFALVPERSGELQLPAAQFSGRGVDRNGLGGMFGGGVRLSAQGESLRLNVRPRPDSATTPWLPARKLELSRVEADTPQTAQVGEPISFTLRLRADGLSADQLPELSLPEIDGATVYPDQESSRDLTTEQSLGAEKLRRFAIVPKRAGSIEISQIGFDWWDVRADQAQRSSLPAWQIQVVGPEPSAAVNADGADESVAVQRGPASAGDGAEAADLWRQPFWAWLSALLALGWAVSWARQRQRLQGAGGRSPAASVQTAEVRPTLPDLRKTLADGDLARIANALRSAAPRGAGPGLPSLAARLADPAQADAVRQLEQALYGAGDAAACLEFLRRALVRPLQWRGDETGADSAETTLPPLYR